MLLVHPGEVLAEIVADLRCGTVDRASFLVVLGHDVGIEAVAADLLQRLAGGGRRGEAADDHDDGRRQECEPEDEENGHAVTP